MTVGGSDVAPTTALSGAPTAHPPRAGRRLRIGLMLRALEERGGIGVYTRNLTEEILALGTEHEYVLFYSTPKQLGRYADRPNVRERVVRAPGRVLWDQVAMPLACRGERLDILLHPKFTVPLLAPCRTAMVLHGADWLLPEQARYYSRLNVALMRVALPLYCRKADVVFSVSELTTRNILEALDLPPSKVRTVYFGPARHFRRVEDPARLEAVRARYGLPERFILTLTKPLGTGRKNLGGSLEGYRLHHGRTDHRLVVGGLSDEDYRSAFSIPEEGWGADVYFPGWIAQEDMPAVYSLADLFLYPSNLEAFPIPITEAMACGTPIVTSDANGLREIAGDAALFVDPSDPEAIAEAIGRALTDRSVRRELRERGRERAGRFSWERCARQTLELLERTAT